MFPLGSNSLVTLLYSLSKSLYSILFGFLETSQLYIVGTLYYFASRMNQKVY